MNPSAAVLALSSIEVDLPVQEGQQVTVMWRGKPLFVRQPHAGGDRRSRGRAMSANCPIRGPQCEPARAAPATDANRAIKPEWLVLIGICTHLGCMPLLRRNAGRLRRLALPLPRLAIRHRGPHPQRPAPKNLAVPPYAFLSDTRIKIG